MATDKRTKKELLEYEQELKETLGHVSEQLALNVEERRDLQDEMDELKESLSLAKRPSKLLMLGIFFMLGIVAALWYHASDLQGQLYTTQIQLRQAKKDGNMHMHKHQSCMEETHALERELGRCDQVNELAPKLDKLLEQTCNKRCRKLKRKAAKKAKHTLYMPPFEIKANTLGIARMASQ